MTEKTAIVTGAGTGIGKSVATTLLKAGWNTVFCGRRKTLLEEAIAEAGKTSARALAVACDISKAGEVDDMFETVVEAFGRVDLLFNNAGMGYKSTLIDEIPVEVWNDVVGVNLTGSFLCARAAFGVMRRQKPMGGRIINNGSVSAYAPRPGSAPYTATKHAITGLTKTLALDGRPY
ncbi:SDR family oxidoreductase, partial [Mesorhizobium sp.]